MLRSQEQKTQLDLETFAQINNDVESLGTELEGNKFTTTINFFISWLQQIELDSKQELIAKFEQLSSVAERIDKERFHIYQRVDGKKKAINSKVNAILPEEFLEKITCLADNESILIPGGWLASKTSAHAMIYELVKNEDSYLLKVYNSGAGLIKHQIKEGCDKIRYAPIKVYEFKLEDPNAKVFIKEFIKELIKPSITPRTQIYGKDEVYNIFESLVRIGGTEVCPYKKGIIKEEIASSD